MDNKLTTQEKIDNFNSDLAKIDDAMNVILSENKERFLKTAWLAIKDNKDLLDCDRGSLLGAIVKSAELGLELNTPMGLAYIIPFKGKATLQIGYKGFLELAFRSGKVSVFEADCVYSKDEFYYEKGLNPQLKHIPSMEIDKGELVAVYAIAVMKDGTKTFVVMSKKEVEAIRIRSKTAQSSYSPWKSDYEMMAKKTVLKRLSKYIPASYELSKAIDLDGRYENGSVQVIDAQRVPQEATDLSEYEDEEPFNGELANNERQKKLVDSVKEGLKAK